MSRRVLLPLRAWSGALVVCALMFCLAGLARPAMAMSSSMGPMESMASMGMAAPAASSGDSSAPGRAEAVGQPTATQAAGARQYGEHCPMADQQCVAPNATVASSVQTGLALTGLPAGAACSAAAVLAAGPNAPPPALPPPDLHRLCVSRT
ncbi:MULTISPECIES: hypothetical protein [unclassified Streptomyces]|uniref:hypothetical protein n=1 Tax=unclassified Streptomyces TaxID=2593676 RepID=UPI0033A13CC5